jgi:dephospho-CoA kinase
LISDIFKSQLSDAEFRKHADKVINNGADIEKTRAQLEIILGI